MERFCLLNSNRVTYANPIRSLCKQDIKLKNMEAWDLWNWKRTVILAPWGNSCLPSYLRKHCLSARWPIYTPTQKGQPQKLVWKCANVYGKKWTAILQLKLKTSAPHTDDMVMHIIVDRQSNASKSKAEQS